MKTIAIIPARANSKRIPRKNMADLGGKPLLAWTVEAALGAESIDRVYVSTESTEIAECLYTDFPDVIVHHRDIALARDDVHASKVVLECLQAWSDFSFFCTHIAMLLPTSPFRTAHHIDEAMASLRSKGTDGIVSVTKSHAPTIRLRYEAYGLLQSLADPLVNLNQNYQQCPPLYIVNGAIFVTRLELFEKEVSFHAGRVAGYEMDHYAGLEIDFPEDLELARWRLNCEGPMVS